MPGVSIFSDLGSSMLRKISFLSCSLDSQETTKLDTLYLITIVHNTQGW
jgi:hypothetical protein